MDYTTCREQVSASNGNTVALETGVNEIQVRAQIDGKTYFVAKGEFRVQAAFVAF